MPLERRDWITKEMLRGERSVLFVFGDNLARWGKGGQAAEMRDEPNAVGLPTKRTPHVFLADRDLPQIEREVRAALDRLDGWLRHGGLVVWPMAGIGTGRADLANKAPKIAEFYAGVLQRLSEIQSG